MSTHSLYGLRAASALVVLAWSTLALASSIDMDYCATINTASMAGNHSIYQSDGLCHDFCNDKHYALAIVQSQYCWCSNYVPDSDEQVSISKCQNQCPGFPDDVCGGDDTFGYMTLENDPSGTAGAGASSTTADSGIKTETKTVQNTVTFKPSSSSTTSSILTSTSTSTTSTMKTTPTPTPSVQTVTVGGTVQTVTATPSAVVGSPSTGNISSKHGGGGLSTGGAVGLAVGLVAVAVGVVGGFIFWCLRRRRRRQEEAGDVYDPSHRSSSAGMMQTPKSPASGDNPQFVFGPAGAGSYESDQSGRRRSGMLRPIDPRLDPTTTGIYNGENKSHDSVNTLRDDHDYSRKVHQPSRVLRATNPDPDLDD